MPNEREWKRYFPHPKKTLQALGLKRDMVFVDLGCGYGTFTIPAAEIVGRKGRVYAMDLDPKMVKSVIRRSRSKRLTNVKALVRDITTLGSSRSKKFVDEDDQGARIKADFVLLANVIHGTKHRVALLKFVSRAFLLRKSKSGNRGRIAILNWKVEKTPRGPPTRIRPTEEQTASYLLKVGFHSPLILQVPPYHYAVIAEAYCYLA